MRNPSAKGSTDGADVAVLEGFLDHPDQLIWWCVFREERNCVVGDERIVSE